VDECRLLLAFGGEADLDSDSTRIGIATRQGRSAPAFRVVLLRTLCGAIDGR
jgi:hypothetical protein